MSPPLLSAVRTWGARVFQTRQERTRRRITELEERARHLEKDVIRPTDGLAQEYIRRAFAASSDDEEEGEKEDGECTRDGTQMMLRRVEAMNQALDARLEARRLTSQTEKRPASTFTEDGSRCRSVTCALLAAIPTALATLLATAIVLPVQIVNPSEVTPADYANTEMRSFNWTSGSDAWHVPPM